MERGITRSIDCIDNTKKGVRLDNKSYKRNIRINTKRANNMKRPKRAANKAIELSQNERSLSRNTEKLNRLNRGGEFLENHGKTVGNAIGVGIDVGISVGQDYYNGSSTSKTVSNAVVAGGLFSGWYCSSSSYVRRSHSVGCIYRSGRMDSTCSMGCFYPCNIRLCTRCN